MQNSSSHRSFFQVVAINKAVNAIFKSNEARKNRQSRRMDITEREIRDLLLALHDCKVKCLLVGGFATSIHGFPRSAHDLDLWVKNEPENMKNLSLAPGKVNMPGAELIKNAQLMAGFETDKQKLKNGKR